MDNFKKKIRFDNLFFSIRIFKCNLCCFHCVRICHRRYNHGLRGAAIIMCTLKICICHGVTRYKKQRQDQKIMTIILQIIHVPPYALLFSAAGSFLKVTFCDLCCNLQWAVDQSSAMRLAMCSRAFSTWSMRIRQRSPLLRRLRALSIARNSP